ncbi:MAG: PKD domain-containing protein [Chloroflexota bacterium]
MYPMTHFKKAAQALTLLLLIVLMIGCNGQSPEAISTPTIGDPKVGSLAPQQPGEEIGISVDVSSGPGVVLSYTWNADGGEIIRGQGSPAITYRAPDEAGTYNVRVKVEWDGHSIEKVTSVKVEVEATATVTPQPPTDTPTPTPTDMPQSTNTPVPTNTQTPPPTVTPTSTNTPTPQPTNTPQPTPTSTATPDPVPVITEVKLREDRSSGDLIIYTDVFFRDLDGDSYYADWELVSTTAESVIVEDGEFEISQAQQKAGTFITGTWHCSGEPFSTEMKITILDQANNRSNEKIYTLDCN